MSEGLHCLRCGKMCHSTQNCDAVSTNAEILEQLTQNCDARDEEIKVGYRTTKLLACKEGAEIFAEGNFEVEICDEAAGEFLTVRELTDDESEIRLGTDEWPALQAAIDLMIGEIR